MREVEIVKGVNIPKELRNKASIIDREVKAYISFALSIEDLTDIEYYILYYSGPHISSTGNIKGLFIDLIIVVPRLKDGLFFIDCGSVWIERKGYSIGLTRDLHICQEGKDTLMELIETYYPKLLLINPRLNKVIEYIETETCFIADINLSTDITECFPWLSANALNDEALATLYEIERDEYIN